MGAQFDGGVAGAREGGGALGVVVAGERLAVRLEDVARLLARPVGLALASEILEGFMAGDGHAGDRWIAAGSPSSG